MASPFGNIAFFLRTNCLLAPSIVKMTGSRYQCSGFHQVMGIGSSRVPVGARCHLGPGGACWFRSRWSLALSRL